MKRMNLTKEDSLLSIEAFCVIGHGLANLYKVDDRSKITDNAQVLQNRD